LLSKRQYANITGRDENNKNVLAYHLRQSFKPGEITPELANKIGYKLAMKFTKGKHAFIVCTHIDKLHIHNHIVFNSTTLDCTKKFRDFLGSGKALGHMSDQICLENGLSIIENPNKKSKHYGEWLGNGKPLSWRNKLKQKIDEVLPSCASFEDFIKAMKAAEYEVSDKRKHITFRAPGQTKPTRLDTLKGDYTELAVRERIEGKRIVAPTQKINLLIDIQNNIKVKSNPGYTQWAKVYNLK
jgi:hypothetical protein